MRHGNFLQVLALLTLMALTAFQYRQSKDQTEAELYHLRVQKSYSNRQSFANEYGPDFKNVIKQKIETGKQIQQSHWDHMQWKVIAILLLALVSVFHFIRYFNVDYDLDHEHLPLDRYDASTWFLNFIFFGIVAGWYAYFSGGYAGAIVGYILGILCATKCLWHISKVVQTLQIKKLKAIRLAEIAIASLIYFHLIGFVVFYYGMMLLKIPALANVLKGN